jgi:excisionase family DNA binding protein
MDKAVRNTTERLEGIVLTASDVAIMLQVSEKTVVRRFKDKTIKSFKLGNKWRTLRTDVDNFLSHR